MSCIQNCHEILWIVKPADTLTQLVSDTLTRASTQMLEEALCCLSLCHRSVVVSILLTVLGSEVAFEDLSSSKSTAE